MCIVLIIAGTKFLPCYGYFTIGVLFKRHLNLLSAGYWDIHLVTTALLLRTVKDDFGERHISGSCAIIVKMISDLFV